MVEKLAYPIFKLRRSEIIWIAAISEWVHAKGAKWRKRGECKRFALMMGYSLRL